MPIVLVLGHIATATTASVGLAATVVAASTAAAAIVVKQPHVEKRINLLHVVQGFNSNC